MSDDRRHRSSNASSPLKAKRKQRHGSSQRGNTIHDRSCSITPSRQMLAKTRAHMTHSYPSSESFSSVQTVDLLLPTKNNVRWLRSSPSSAAGGKRKQLRSSSGSWRKRPVHKRTRNCFELRKRARNCFELSGIARN